MKALIWGTGVVAEEITKECVLRSADIIAYVDNNPVKWEKNFLNKKIISPDGVPDQTFDFILLASSFEKEINAQLSDLGIDQKRILLTHSNKKSLKKLGPPKILNIINNYKDIYNLTRDKYKDIRIVQGINNGNIHTGPLRAEIYPTYHCNLHCIACWVFSPLCKRPFPPKDSHLPTDVFLKVINDLADMKTKEITLVGGGEPFLHPAIFEAIELIKKRGMRCTINTGMHTLKEHEIERLFDLSVEQIICSIWAGDPETYSKTHPVVAKNSFEKIEKRLHKIKELKEKHNSKYPGILIHNVICNINYKNVPEMIKFAHSVGADGMRFTPIDIVEDETDTLLLSAEQKEELLVILDQQGLGSGESKTVVNEGKPFSISGLDIFTKRVKERTGFSVDYDLIKKMPCTIGWQFLIIHPSGNVIPCCKGINHPVGNVLNHSISDIWQSVCYRDFSNKARDLDKGDPYFKNIKCFRFCDNLHDLINYDKKMKDPSITNHSRLLQKISDYFFKLPEKILDKFFNINLPAKEDMPPYLSLPIEDLNEKVTEQHDQLWPLEDLRKRGVFKDETGRKRGIKIQTFDKS